MSDEATKLAAYATHNSTPGELAPPKVEKPMQTLASPVGGALIPERQVEWLTKMAESWTTMPDEIKDTMILLQRGFAASGGGTYFLTPPQALMIVRYCREKGIAVHSDTWWFDPKNYRIGSTVSGLREEARARKIDLGAPQLKRITRPWPPTVPQPKGVTFTEDVGYNVQIYIGYRPHPANCDVWLSTSFRDTPVWRSNWDHMLQVRGIGTCTKFAMGSGISQMPEDIDESAKGENG